MSPLLVLVCSVCLDEEGPADVDVERDGVDANGVVGLRATSKYSLMEVSRSRETLRLDEQGVLCMLLASVGLLRSNARRLEDRGVAN